MVEQTEMGESDCSKAPPCTLSSLANCQLQLQQASHESMWHGPGAVAEANCQLQLQQARFSEQSASCF